jgi:hypothetical protein
VPQSTKYVDESASIIHYSVCCSNGTGAEGFIAQQGGYLFTFPTPRSPQNQCCEYFASLSAFTADFLPKAFAYGPIVSQGAQCYKRLKVLHCETLMIKAKRGISGGPRFASSKGA